MFPECLFCLAKSYSSTRYNENFPFPFMYVNIEMIKISRLVLSRKDLRARTFVRVCVGEGEVRV